MMSGFSSEWLALREAVDHRSLNATLKSKVETFFANCLVSVDQPLKVLDLGCGSGSNLRALAGFLPDFQHWTMVDHDLELLTAARQTLSQWGGTAPWGRTEEAMQPSLDLSSASASILTSGHAQDGPEPLLIKYAGKTIQIEFSQVDLDLSIERLLERPFDLVTAAAFFDLVSEKWIKRFCENLKTSFYTTLIYNGMEQWLPQIEVDKEVLRAFHQDQTRDKGFGIAAGPQATQALMDRLQANHFLCDCASSPWVLDGLADRSLIERLSSGSLEAVRRTRSVSESMLEKWSNRNRNLTQCTIGHWDLWAYPKKDP